MNKHPNRRIVMLGAAAAGAAFATSSSLLNAATDTPIARLWTEAERLRGQLAPFTNQIAAAEASNIGHLSGWAYLEGDARALGSARHDILMKLLVSQPQNKNDIRIMAAAANDHEIIKSPGRWAVIQDPQVAGYLAAA